MSGRVYKEIDKSLFFNMINLLEDLQIVKNNHKELEDDSFIIDIILYRNIEERIRYFYENYLYQKEE